MNKNIQSAVPKFKDVVLKADKESRSSSKFHASYSLGFRKSFKNNYSTSRHLVSNENSENEQNSTDNAQKI